jgi:hypothetical protein
MELYPSYQVHGEAWSRAFLMQHSLFGDGGERKEKDTTCPTLPMLRIALLISLCIRVMLGIWDYSGFGVPPMHGDFEAPATDAVSEETCLSSLILVLQRQFPFSRGIFEDKVANLWYMFSSQRKKIIEQYNVEEDNCTTCVGQQCCCFGPLSQEFVNDCWYGNFYPCGYYQVIMSVAAWKAEGVAPTSKI